MDLGPHVELFTNFASSHLKGEADDDYHIQLKLDHSLRVLANAQAIIDGEEISGRAKHLATLAALYHDIGRFPQFRTYGTFKDVDSTNHGRLGLLTLRDQKLPGLLPDQDIRLIRAAVGLHNAKDVNPNLRKPLKTIVNIVRDSDKLDIFGVLLDHLDLSADPNRVVIHSLEEHPDKYSPAVLQSIMDDKTCGYTELVYSNDFILILVGWLFTLSYTTTICLLSERKLLERTFDLLPKDKNIQELKEKAFTFMHYNIKRTP